MAEAGSGAVAVICVPMKRWAAGRKRAALLLEPWASVYFPSLPLRRALGGNTGMSFEESVASIYSNSERL